MPTPGVLVTLRGVTAVLEQASKSETVTEDLKKYIENNNLLADPEVPKLILKACDYVIFNVSEDEDKANELHKRMQKLGLVGFLFDESSNGTFDDMRDVYHRATIKFFIVSNKIGAGVKSMEIMKHKTELLMHDMRKADRSIVPIWCVDKYDLDDDSFDALYGIRSVSGLDPNSSYFDRKVYGLRDDPLNAAKKMEYDAKQKRKLVSYLEKMKKKIEENGPTEVRGPDYIPTSAGGSTPPVVQAQTVNHYNITIQQAENVVTRAAGSQNVAMHAPATASDIKTRFTVDVRFWEEQAQGDGISGYSHDGPETMQTDDQSSYSQQPSDLTEDNAGSSTDPIVLSYPHQVEDTDGKDEYTNSCAHAHHDFPSHVPASVLSIV